MFQLGLQRITERRWLLNGPHEVLFLDSMGHSLIISTHAGRHFLVQIGPRGGLTVSTMEDKARTEWINAPQE